METEQAGKDKHTVPNTPNQIGSLSTRHRNAKIAVNVLKEYCIEIYDKDCEGCVVKDDKGVCLYEFFSQTSKF